MNPSKLLIVAAALSFGVTATSALAGVPKVMNKCKTCHTFDQGGKHKVGPNLFGVIGRQAGTTDFKKYKGLAGSDVVWDEDNLDKWLENPKKFLGGKKTSMSAKTKKEKDRKAIIEFLEDLK